MAEERFKAPLPPGEQVPEEEQERFQADLPDYTADLPLPTPKPKEPDFEYDPVEHFGNTVSSFYEMAKNIVTAIVMSPKSGYDFIQSGEYKQLADAWSYKGAVAEFAKDVTIGPYQEKGLRILYEDPAVPVVDALTLFTGGAGAITKTGKIAGRLAPAGSKAAKNAARIAQFGQKMERMPLDIARAAYDKTMGKVTGIDWKLRRMLLAGKRREAGISAKYVSEVGEPIMDVLRPMTKEERTLLDKLLTQGGSLDELSVSPRVQRAFEMVDDWVTNERQFLLKERGFMDEGGFNSVVHRKMASEILLDDDMGRMLEKFERHGLTQDHLDDFLRKGEITDDMAEVAKALYDKLDVKPVYVPYYHSRRGVGSRLNDELFGQKPIYRLYARANVGFQRRFKGTVGRIKDPRIYLARGIDDWARFRGDIRWFDDIAMQPGFIKGISTQAPKEALKHGIVAKYFGSERAFVAAQKQFYRDLIKTKGKDEAFRLMTTDAKTNRLLQEAKHVILDDGIRKMLDLEFRQLGGPLAKLVSIYDKILGAFRATATIMNPRWYTGNAVGDVMLSILANGLGGRYRNIGKIRKLLPEAESIGRRGIGVEVGAASFDRIPVLRDLPSLTEHIDAAARAGIISNAIAKKLKTTGKKFFESAESLDDAVIRIAGVSREYSQLLFDMNTAMEQVVRGSPVIQKMNGRIALLEKNIAVKEAELLEYVSTVQRGRLGKMKWEKKKETHFSKREETYYKKARKEINKREKQLDNLRLRRNDRKNKRDQALADLRDTFDVQARLMEKYPKLKQIHDEVILPAVERANSFVGDYRGLSPFEQKVMRRVVPFYSWVKAMGQLAFKLPVIAPKSTFLWHRYAESMWTMIGDDDLPEYMKNAVPVFTRENGDSVWLNFNSLSPFNSLRMSRFFDKPIPGQFALWEGNPFINLAFRGAGGTTPFVSSSIPYGEPMVNMGNGDVYRHAGNGEIEKVIPQAPAISSMAHMFPVVQMVEQLLYRHRMTHDGWLLQPDPVLNPDGSYRYPTELWQSVASTFGPRVSIRSKASFAEAEKRRVIRFLNKLKTEYKRADPSRKEYIRGIFEDYKKADGFRVKYR